MTNKSEINDYANNAVMQDKKYFAYQLLIERYHLIWDDIQSLRTKDGIMFGVFSIIITIFFTFILSNGVGINTQDTNFTILIFFTASLLWICYLLHCVHLHLFIREHGIFDKGIGCLSCLSESWIENNIRNFLSRGKDAKEYLNIYQILAFVLDFITIIFILSLTYHIVQILETGYVVSDSPSFYLFVFILSLILSYLILLLPIHLIVVLSKKSLKMKRVILIILGIIVSTLIFVMNLILFNNLI